MVSSRRIPAPIFPAPRFSGTAHPREAALRTEPPHQHTTRPPFCPAITFDNRIVFNFFRGEDFRIREVVSMRDITNDGEGPSWGKLLEILSAKQPDGTSVFDEKVDMMLFDQRICVQDERQFIAAIQWMSNMEDHSRNVNVPIHEASRDTRSKLWSKEG